MRSPRVGRRAPSAGRPRHLRGEQTSARPARQSIGNKSPPPPPPSLTMAASRAGESARQLAGSPVAGASQAESGQRAPRRRREAPS